MADVKPRKRPGTILTAAVLLILFGLHSMLASTCGAILSIEPEMYTYVRAVFESPRPRFANEPDPTAALKAVTREAPGLEWLGRFAVVSGILLGTFAVLAGRGVFQMRPIGRDLGITVALLYILTSIIQNTYTLAYVLPVIEQVQGKSDSDTVFVAWLFGFVGQLLVWGTVLGLLRSQSAKHAFANNIDAVVDEPPSSPNPP